MLAWRERCGKGLLLSICYSKVWYRVVCPRRARSLHNYCCESHFPLCIHIVVCIIARGSHQLKQGFTAILLHVERCPVGILKWN